MSGFEKMAAKYSVALDKTIGLGQMNLRKYSFRTVGYLKLNISLVVFENAIIYKELSLETVSKLKCRSGGEINSGLLDYQYLSSAIGAGIAFPLQGCPSCGNLESDKLDVEKLHSLEKAYPHIRFRPRSGSSQKFNDLVFKSYMAYDLENVNDEMVKMVSNERYGEIEDLLFCPNYSVSINAFEALFFLNTEGKITLTHAVQTKMDELKNAPISIRVVCGRDCIVTKPSYKSLEIAESAILKKYRESIAGTNGASNAQKD
jgi:hypothetical protein